LIELLYIISPMGPSTNFTRLNDDWNALAGVPDARVVVGQRLRSR
jgi:hypothetical protein